MAKTGFSVKGNLNEIKAGSLALRNLLSGGSEPFRVADAGLFQTNLRYDENQRMDFIPDGYTFGVRIDSPNVGPETTIVNVQRINNSSPDVVKGTLNLRVSADDVVLNSPESEKADNYIIFVSRPQVLPDTGTITLTRGIQNGEGPFYTGGNIPEGFLGGGQINAFENQDGINEFVYIKKNQQANYNPATGRFTFGKDISFTFTQNDEITKITIKGRDDTPLDTDNGLYPLKIDEFDVSENNQISFILKGRNNSPIKFTNSPNQNVLKSDTPGGLNIKPTDVIRFFRKLPVYQKDIHGWVPPLLRSAGGPQTSIDVTEETAQSLWQSEKFTSIYPAFESSDLMYNLGTSQTDDPYPQNVQKYNTVLDNIRKKIDVAKEIAITRITIDSPYNNPSNSDIIIDGILKIQDFGNKNSPGDNNKPGFDTFNNCPFGPAVYIKEGENYNRAFSTFDGPWSADSTTGNHKIYTHGNSPAHDEYVQDLIVNDLVFEDRVVLDGFADYQIQNSDTSLVGVTDVNAPLDSPRSVGFQFKMPVIVQELDETTNKYVDQTYFLLLRQVT